MNPSNDDSPKTQDAPPSDPGSETPSLTFEKADYGAADTRPAMRCASCQKPVAGVYYEAVGQFYCETCKTQWFQKSPPTKRLKRFMRASFYGLVAALTGAALYYGIQALTGYSFGLIAVVVGFLVGAAVKAGSEKRGGWRYQALAIFLTYSATVWSYMGPLWKEMDSTEWKSQTQSAPRTSVSSGKVADAKTPPLTKKEEERVHVITKLVFILPLAYLLPFIGGVSLMGWLIMGFGLYEAWKINQSPMRSMRGPFRLNETDAPPAVTPTPP